MTTSDENPKLSPSGSPIVRHLEETPWSAAAETKSLQEISSHIEKYLGKVPTVFHEMASDTVHIDVHLVLPAPQYPFYRLVTSGMSDLPMSVPREIEAPRYLELIMTLPPNWRLDEQSFKEDKWYWPVRLIRTLARFPFKHKTWLGSGHTASNADPNKPYSFETNLCCAMLSPSPTVPLAFHKLRINSAKEITFLAVIPLYEDEVNFKLKEGTGALLDKFDTAKLTDLVDPYRPSVLPRKKLFRLF